MHGGSENVARVLVATMIDLTGEREVRATLHCGMNQLKQNLGTLGTLGILGWWLVLLPPNFQELTSLSMSDMF